jgi:pilus assembly protein CpaF
MSTPAKLEIRRPDHEPTRFEIEPAVYTIGRDADCNIQLNSPEIEGRHAILTVRDGGAWIEDIAGGTLLAGEPVRGRAAVGSGVPIRLSHFTLVLTLPDAGTATPPPARVPSSPAAPPPLTPGRPPIPSPFAAATAATPPPAPVPPAIPVPPPPAARRAGPDAPAPKNDLKRSIKQQIHSELVERLDIKRLTASHMQHDQLSVKVRTTLQSIIDDVRTKLPPGVTPDELIKEIYDEALGLGPLEDLLADENVSEIMVNGPDRIYVESGGKLQRTGLSFMDDSSVHAIIERIVSPIGRRIDESQPYVDARLPDGSRVNAIIHPLSLTGPCLTIRKFSKVPFTDRDLIRFGTLTQEMADFLKLCIQLRKNIIVSGGTGSGKTTFLNMLSGYLPEGDRIVTIEDAAELRLTQDHVIRLESRPPNIEGRGAITIRDLVRNALRMRPDRIVVGECRGGESLDMLQAMNTGHDGSLTTVHANTPRDVISRLETMVLMSGMDLPARAIREQIAAAVDLIAHEARLSDGSRRITKITEVLGLEGNQIVMQDIFEYKQTGLDPHGRVKGFFTATGSVPTFLENLAARGLAIDHSIFSPVKEDSQG